MPVGASQRAHEVGFLPLGEMTPVLRLSTLDLTDEVRFFWPPKGEASLEWSYIACFPASHGKATGADRDNGNKEAGIL